MSPEVISLLIGALSVFVGTTIVFGHRCSDKKDKFDEKPKTDELNEIRLRMRYDATMSSLDAIWRFLYREMNAKKVEDKVKIEDLKVDMLFYDTNIREYFNKLINDFERTLKESINVKNVWDALRCKYGQMGKVLYLFGGIEALAGYSLIALIALNAFPTVEPYYLLGITLFIAAIFFVGLITYIQIKISRNSKIYNGIKNNWIGDVRIAN